MEFTLEVKPLLELKLLKNIKKEEGNELTPDEIEEYNFARPVGMFFLKERLKLPNSSQVILAKDKMKNIYLAKMFYRKVKNKTLEIEGDNIDFVYKQLANVDFWKDKISYMFKYADATTLSYFAQTVNGVFGWYFSRYQRLKNMVEAKDINAEDKMLLASIRSWKKEDAINCFYCYVVRLYRYLNPVNDYPNRQIYYNYIKYLCNIAKVPKIKPVTLENSSLLRGLLLQFKERFTEFCIMKEIDINTILDYKEFEELCELKGVDFEDSVLLNKELNDIIGSAMEKFTVC